MSAQLKPEACPDGALTLRVLRSGREAQAAGLAALLGHKGEPYRCHLADFLGADEYGIQEGLRWHFHAAFLGDEPVGNVCVWNAFGVGILGHVYTAPAARGQGIARRLLADTCADFDARGGLRLMLNTEPGSFQEQLYASLGFVPLASVAGAMRRGSPPTREVAGRLRVIGFTWRRWPALNEFLVREDVPVQRWLGGNAEVPCSAEGPLLQARYGHGGQPCAMAVLVDSAEAVHGFACRLGDADAEIFTPVELHRWREALEGAV